VNHPPLQSAQGLITAARSTGNVFSFLVLFLGARIDPSAAQLTQKGFEARLGEGGALDASCVHGGATKLALCHYHHT